MQFTEASKSFRDLLPGHSARLRRLVSRSAARLEMQETAKASPLFTFPQWDRQIYYSYEYDFEGSMRHREFTASQDRMYARACD